MTPKERTTSWGGVADWYDDAVNREGSYQYDLILPNLLRLMSPKNGEKILDVACGQGFFAEQFAKKGADVIGIDIAPELIAIAKKNTHDKIKYFVGSADHMRDIADAGADKVSMVLALQNMENAKKVFAECHRVLKSGGALYIVLNHPAFRVPHASSWGWDERGQIQYRRIDAYLSESKTEIMMHPGAARAQKDKDTTVSFHRPLQYYGKLLASAGFCIGRLEEWESHKKSEAGPRARAEDLARREIPMFLFLEAKKLLC